MDRENLIHLHAANAPSEIPAWFDDIAFEEGLVEREKLPQIPTEPPKALRETEQWQQPTSTGGKMDNIDPSLGFSEENGVPAHLVLMAEKFFADVMVARQKVEAVQARNKSRRYFAWRLYYAEAMVRSIENGKRPGADEEAAA